MSQELELTGSAGTVTLDAGEIVAKDLEKVATGIGTARIDVPENDAIIPFVQRQDRVNYRVDGDTVFSGYAVGFAGNERTGRWTLRVDGIGKRLEETRPNYDALGGSLVYSNTALDDAIEDYWSRTPFNATVTPQSPELVAENEEVHEANTTAEFETLFAPGDTDAQLAVSDTYRPAQASFTTESEDLSNSNTGLQTDTEYSADEAERLLDGTSSLDLQFTVDYTIPEDAVSVWVRLTTGGPAGTGSGPGIELTLNGDTWQPVSTGATFGGLQWADLANDTFGEPGTYSGGDLTPGTYTLQIDGVGTGDGQDIDVVAPLDNRFSWTFDNDTTGTAERVDGPELFPEAITAESTITSTSLNIPRSEVTSTIDDTTGTQRISVSNDGGVTYADFDNTTTVGHDYGDAGREARLKLRLGRYGSRTGATPETGYLPQTVSAITHTVDLNDLVVIDELELSRNHFDNLKKLHNYGDYLWTIEHDDAAVGDLTVNSYPRGAITRTTPAALENPDNRTPEVAAEVYFNSIYLQGRLRDDGTRPTAEVTDDDAVAADNREISPGVLRDSSIATEAGATFRANALLQTALNNNDLRGSVTTYPEDIHPGYGYPIDFGEGEANKTLERLNIRESADDLQATYEFVVKPQLAETLNRLKSDQRDVGDQV